MKVALCDANEFNLDCLSAMISNSNSKYEVEYKFTFHEMENLNVKVISDCNLLITDISNPYTKSVEFFEKLRDELPSLKIVVLSYCNDPYILKKLILAGIRSYMSKAESFETIMKSIEILKTNNFHFIDDLERIINPLIQKSIFHTKYSTISFSERELLIAQFIRSEFTTKQIANQLSLSIKTIEFYRSNILEKTNCKSMLGAIQFMIENKYLPEKADC